MNAARSTRSLVFALGVAQLIAWGTLYYAIAVIGEPMRSELGVSKSALFGAFAWSQLISGLLSPAAGRALDRYGARVVLAASGCIGALGFLVLASAQSFLGLLVGWSICGLAMALGLYEACFAAIGQAQLAQAQLAQAQLAQPKPDTYRRAVTSVTLIAGLASTVAWPASHYLVQLVGWRATCAVHAAALIGCAPIYWAVLPSLHGSRVDREAQKNIEAPLDVASLKRARVLALAFAGAAVMGASMSAHLVGTLSSLRFPPEQAVWIASSIGVLQVVGRLLEVTLGSRVSPQQLGLFTFGGLLVSMGLLLAGAERPAAIFGFALLYGISHGLVAIAKATLPVDMFGLENVGALLGRFSAPSLFARALAPFAFAWVSSELNIQAALIGLVSVGLASLAAYAVTTRSKSQVRAP